MRNLKGLTLLLMFAFIFLNIGQVKPSKELNKARKIKKFESTESTESTYKRSIYNVCLWCSWNLKEWYDHELEYAKKTGLVSHQIEEKIWYAKKFYKEGKFEKAKTKLDEIIRELDRDYGPKDYDFWKESKAYVLSKKAEILAEQGRYEEAIKNLGEAYKLYRDMADDYLRKKEFKMKLDRSLYRVWILKTVKDLNLNQASN